MSSRPKTDPGDTITSHVFELQAGHIHGRTLIGRVSPINDEGQLGLPGEVEGVILGGTGAYAFARGTYTISRDGDQLAYAFDIRCD